MTKADRNELHKMFGGSFLSRLFLVLHLSLVFLSVFYFIAGEWKLGIFTVCAALLVVYVAYRLTGGKQNPAIWEGKDLYNVLRYAADTRQAKIGFHSLRDQSLLLDKLESIGITKKPSQDTRQFIRDKIVDDHQVFDICRDDVIIQMIHNGKECFWDGYGNKTTAQFFHKAEIIFELKSSVDYAFYEVLEGLEGWFSLVDKSYKCGVKGEYRESLCLAQKALQLNPRASEAWRLIGNAYEFLGDEMEKADELGQAEEFYKNATEAWDKAKEINPKIKITGYHK